MNHPAMIWGSIHYHGRNRPLAGKILPENVQEFFPVFLIFSGCQKIF